MAVRYMTEEEERYLWHAVGHDPLIASYLSNQVHYGQDFMRTAVNLPVCERCESAALYHEGGVLCPKCGHFGRNKGHRVKNHLKEGWFR